MKKNLKIFLMIVALITSKYANAQQWQPTSGPPGIVHGFTFIGSDIFIASQNGVFRSTDNGANWTITGFQSGFPWASCIVSLGSNLFIGTTGAGGAGVLRSTDNGTSWTQVNNGLPHLNITSLGVIDGNLIAGVYDGYRSTDNGESWTELEGYSFFPISAVVSDTNLFIGTESGILHSTDNGANWTNVNNAAFIRYVIDSSSIYCTIRSLCALGTNLFAGTYEKGIFRSTDLGTSWTIVKENEKIQSLAASGGNLFAGTFKGVLLSTDNGESWISINNGLMGAVVKGLAVSGTNLIASASNGIFYSTNEGITWTGASVHHSSSASPTNFSYNKVFVFGSNLFVGTTSYGVIRSTDNGVNWYQLSKGLPIEGIYYSDKTGNKDDTSYYNLNSQSFCALGTNIFVATDNSVYRSTDNGENWSNLDGPAGITSFAITDTVLFAVKSSTIYRSTNNGVSWEAVLGDGGGYEQIIFSGANITVFAVGGMFRGSKDDLSHLIYTPLPATVTSAGTRIYAALGTNLFAGTTGRGVFRSTDNGSSWSEMKNGLPQYYYNGPSDFYNFIYSFAVSEKNLFAGISGGVWNHPLNALNSSQISLSQSFISFGAVYKDSTKSSMLKIANNVQYSSLIIDSVYTKTESFTVTSLHDTLAIGDTLSVVVSFTPDTTKQFNDSLYIISNSVQSLVKIPLSGNGVATVALMSLNKSTLSFGTVKYDTTKSDTLRISNSSPFLLMLDSLYTKTESFVVMSLRDTLATDDTLSVVVSFAPDSIKEYNDTLYIVSNAVTPMVKIPLSGNGVITNVEKHNTTIPQEFALLQNYPNPFNPSTTINYQLPKNSFVTLKVFDVLGKEVAELVSEEKPAGSYEVKFDASHISSGIYFYMIKAGSFSATKKLLLLK